MPPKKSWLFLSLAARAEKQDATSAHYFGLGNALGKLRKLMQVIAGEEDGAQFVEGGKAVHTLHAGKPRLSVFAFPSMLLQNFRLYSRLSSLHKEHGFAGVYERLDLGFFAGCMLARRRHLPLVYECNGLLDEETLLRAGTSGGVRGALLSWWFGYLLRQADAVVVNTKELQGLLKRRFGIAHVEVVENGAPMVRAAPPPTLRGTVKLAYVGKLDHLHQLASLLEEVAKASDVSLEVIGDGHTRPTLEARFAGMQNIHFLGALSEKDSFARVREAHAGVLVTSGHPLFEKHGYYFCPLKALLYAAVGRPLLLFGPKNSFLGHLIDLGEAAQVDPNRLHSFLDNWRKHPALYEKMCTQALVAAKRFSWKNAALKTDAVFQGLESRQKR